MKNERASIMIETSIVLPMFMIMMLCIYGLFGLTSAQNQITTSLIQASKSMSLDPYLTEHVNSVAEAKTFWGGLGDQILDFARLSNSTYFSSAGNWYAAEGSGGVETIAKRRFIGFLSDGNVAEANKTLKDIGVVDGLNGMTFQASVSGKLLTITVTYKLQFLFDRFNLGKIPIEQSITSRLWGGSNDGSGGNGSGVTGGGSGGGGGSSWDDDGGSSGGGSGGGGGGSIGGGFR